MKDINQDKLINQLIDAALTDGLITDKERSIIRQMAAKQHLDPDAVELVLDARLQQQQQQQRERLHKCPYCGEILKSFTSHCPSCGHELAARAVSSIEELNKKLVAVNVKAIGKKAAVTTRRDIIATFPVPNNREDLIEFLTLAASKSGIKGGMTGTPKRRCILVLAIVWGLFMLYGILDPFLEPDRFKVSQIEGVVRGILVFTPVSIVIGALPAWLFAVYGGDKDTNEHNDFAEVWRDKFNQCMMKARLTLKKPEDVATLNRLEQEVNKK